MYKKITIFCFTFFILMCSLHGQDKVLRGIITSGSEMEESSFIIVELYDTSFALLSYIPLDEKKFFEVSIDSTHRIVNLVVSKLGCDIYTKRVDFIEHKTVFATIQLENCIQQLEEVVVRADKSFIKEHGDTLSFNVEGFKTETDVNLGDILSRIPGVEISSTNQILYQGKRVQQIWVQGRDILNNQHSLAIEGLKVEDIEKIQIIHEYKPFHKRFSQEYTGGVAMNIGLNESARGRINGEVEAFAGIENKYNIDGEAIRVKSQRGDAVFLRSNNIGVPLIQPLEYLGLMTNFEQLKQTQSGEVSVVPDALMPDSDAFGENQHLFVSNSDFDVGKKTRAKISFLSLYKTIEKKAAVQTDFFDTNNSFIGQNEENSQFPLLFANINLKQEQSENLLIEFDMPVLFNQQRSEYLRSGFYGQNPYRSLFFDKEHQWHYSPKLSVSIRHQPNWSSTHTVEAEIKDNVFDVAFSEEEDVKPIYNQKLKNSHQNFTLLSSVQNKHKLFLLKIWNRLNIGHFSTNIIADNLLIYDNESDYSYQYHSWQPTIQYGIKNTNWMTHLQIEVAQNYQIVNDQSFQQTWLNPLFRFKYNWHLSKFIGLSVGQTQKYIDQKNAFNLYLMEDNLQIRHYALENGLSTITKEIDFYFYNLQKDKNASINCNFYYQETTNAISQFNSFVGDFIISEVFLAPKMRSGTFAVSFSHPILNKKYEWKAQVKSRLSMTDRNLYASIKEQQLNLLSRFSTIWDGRWNVYIENSCRVTKQNQETLSQTWYSWTSVFGIRYKTKKWNTMINYDWQLNHLKVSSFHIHQLDFTFEYLLNGRWSIGLRGQDVFNLGNSQSLQLISTPAFIEQSTYTRLQGSITIGASYTFRRK